MKPRVRFAPSPTGFLHVGGLRTALYNFLYARKHGGDFILRIEDTDRERYVEGAVLNLLKTLHRMGLDADEGLSINDEDEVTQSGKFGPYVQSERLKIYARAAAELVEKGRAYYCFCTAERLGKLRAEQQVAKKPMKYDGLCRKLGAEIVQRRLQNNELHVIRLDIPATGKTGFTDLIRGKIEFENALIDHQVLMKSDGFPTYHLANVVDDHLMEITTVIRGEEWVSSTPKHILLYDAFGWKPPEFAHLPLLLNADRTKLSKRQGDVAVDEYLKKGYLPSALINFVALLGWNPSADREMFELKELIAAFEVGKINKSGAVFNLEKLDWLNGQYIKRMPIGRLVEACLPHLIEKKFLNKKGRVLVLAANGEKVTLAWLSKIISLERERMKKLSEVGADTYFFFQEIPAYESSLLIWKKSDRDETKRILGMLAEYLQTLKTGEWTEEKLERHLRKLIGGQDLGVGDVLWPLRVALTGAATSPPPFVVAAILGRKKTVERLCHGAEMLGV